MQASWRIGSLSLLKSRVKYGAQRVGGGVGLKSLPLVNSNPERSYGKRIISSKEQAAMIDVEFGGYGTFFSLEYP
jgi:hypothetical protein